MTFYLIGLGLDLKSMSLEALEILKECEKIYLEGYTINFPYSVKEIEKILGRKVEQLNREKVESEEIIEELRNKDKNIALLVYGSPLIATTHISLMLACKKKKIPYKIIHSASIFDAVSETGLQLYKFGKITNITKHESESFFKIIEENENCGAHNLILLDIGLSVSDALKKLQEIAKKRNFKLKDVVVCSRLGTKEAVMRYDSVEKLSKIKFKLPACFIIPSKLHFLEEEALENLGK